MKQILQSLKSGTTDIAEVPVPKATHGQLLIQTSHTLVSTGTERMLVEFGKANWLDKARRDLIVQNPAHSDNIFGTFALRSPVRPNPIGTVLAKLVSVDGPNLIVRGLDCLDGTPLIDLKPDRCAFTPKAPPKD